jgi:hypothetical protein
MNDKKVRNAECKNNRGGAESRRVRKGDLAQGGEQWEQAESAEGASARTDRDELAGRGSSEVFGCSIFLGSGELFLSTGRSWLAAGACARPPATHSRAPAERCGWFPPLGVAKQLLSGFGVPGCRRGPSGLVTMDLMGSQGWSRLGLKIKAGFNGI